MKGVRTGSSGGDEPQFFGFLPQDTIGKMQSPNYDIRIESSQNILDYVPTIPISDIDVPQFLRFIQDYVTDANLKVAQNCSLIVGEVIKATKETNDVPVHMCVSIAISQLRDKRRFVIQLGVAVLGDLIRASSGSDVLAELEKQVSTAPSSIQTQIFRAFTALMTQKVLDPDLLLNYPFSFDSALISNDSNIKQAALWCVDYLKANYPSTYDSLVTLLSPSATRAICRAPQPNPGTAIPKYRTHGPQIIRPINTAGVVEAARSPMAFSQTGNYRRPALPSAGARRLMSLSRPVTTTFSGSMDSFVDDIDLFGSGNNSGERFSASLKPERNDDDLFGDLPPIDSKPIIGSIFENDNDTKPIIDTIFENEDPKPKVGRAHFDAAVFDNIPKAKTSFPKQPKQTKALRDKLHKEFDETPIQGNFGNSHFDESAFNDIEPLTKPKNKQNDHQQPERFITKAKSALGDLPPSKIDSQLEPKSKFLSPGSLATEGLEIIATKPKRKVKSVIFSPIDKEKAAEKHTMDPDARPIHSSGDYNFGNDSPFDDNLPATPVLRHDKQKKKPRKVLTVKPKTPVASLKKVEKKVPNTPNANDLIDNLQSDDWEVQNSAISALTKSYPPDVVKANLRSAMTSLLECAKSTRTTLAKNALNLILIWINDQEVPVSPVAEIMSTKLLKLLQQQASHHFIVDLAKNCFVALLENITENKIATIVKRESKSPFSQVRAMVANGVYLSIKNIEDPIPFLVPLAILGKDADQNARKSAKLAVKEIAAKKSDFVGYIKENVASQEDQNTLIKLSTAP